MKKLSLLTILACLFGFVGISYAQTTAVTGTITDSSGQLWASARIQATIYNPNGTQITQAGAPVPSTSLTVTATADGSGVFSMTLLDNNTLTPTNTKWIFTVCSFTAAQCSALVPTVITGGSQSVTTLMGTVIVPNFPAGPSAFGYADSEVYPSPQAGAFYYNVISAVQRIWSGSAWSNNAGGGSISLTTTGSNCAAPTLSGGVLNIPPCSPTGGGVTSFNSRTGAVSPAANDYSFSQLSGNPTSAQIGSAGTLTNSISGNAATATTATAATTATTATTASSATTATSATTAGNLTSAAALPNGTSATTQAVTDTSTDLATDQFIANIFATPPAFGSGTPNNITGAIIKATTSLLIGATAPTSCGSAAPCLGMLGGSTLTTPTTAQFAVRYDSTTSQFRFTENALGETRMEQGQVNAQTGTSYTVVLSDDKKLLSFSNAAAVAVTLPAATTAGFTAGAIFNIYNKGAGTVTVTPTTSTINGAASLALTTGQGVDIYSDGTNYQIQGIIAASGSNYISSLTTTGTSGPATVSSGVLNIPQYSGGTTTTYTTIAGPTTDTTLNGALAAAATTIPVVSTTGYPTSGWFMIGNLFTTGAVEFVSYTGISGNSFTGVTRSQLNTTAPSSWATAAPITFIGAFITKSLTGYPLSLTFYVNNVTYPGLSATQYSNFSYYGINQTPNSQIVGGLVGSYGGFQIVSTGGALAGAIVVGSNNGLAIINNSSTTVTNFDGVGSIPSFYKGTPIASASTIAPTAAVTHITGTTAIVTITAPSGCTVTGLACTIKLIPDGLWTTTAAGNIAIASTAVVSKALEMTYDQATTKWYPSY